MHSRLRFVATLLMTIAVGTAAAQQPTPPAPAPAPTPKAEPAPAPAAAPAQKAESAAVAVPAAVAVVPAAPKAAQVAQASEFQKKLSEFLLRGITLSAEQKHKLDSLMASHREDRMAFAGTVTMDSATIAARVRIVRKHMAENRALLTEEQQKQYDKNVTLLRELFTAP